MIIRGEGLDSATCGAISRLEKLGVCGEIKPLVYCYSVRLHYGEWGSKTFYEKNCKDIHEVTMFLEDIEKELTTTKNSEIDTESKEQPKQLEPITHEEIEKDITNPEIKETEEKQTMNTMIYTVPTHLKFDKETIVKILREKENKAFEDFKFLSQREKNAYRSGVEFAANTIELQLKEPTPITHEKIDEIVNTLYRNWFFCTKEEKEHLIKCLFGKGR